MTRVLMRDVATLPPSLRVRQMAELLDMSEGQVYDGIKRGEIPSLRIGRRIVIPTAKVLELLGIPMEAA